MFMFTKNIQFLFQSNFFVKKLHKDSYSILSITLSCKFLRYNLSNGLIVCWSFSICCSYLLCLFVIIFFNIFLPKNEAQAVPADNEKTINPTPVIDRVIEVDVAAIITTVSTVSNIVFRVL